MSKRPITEILSDKFNECKDKVNEEMRKQAVINRVKRQILDASGKHRRLLKHQLVALYYEAIHHLCFNIRDDETEFYKALKNVMNKVENRIDKNEMICALAQFCRNHPANLTPGILHDYAARWHHRVNNNLFVLINKLNYKPFWDWMISRKIDDFDLLNMIYKGEFTFEEIISWIASDEEYTEEFFEVNFDFFMEQVFTCVDYTEGEENPLTLTKVFDTIFRILPQYEIKVLNYAFLYCLDEETAGFLSVKNLVETLNYMADYEYVVGKDVFCCTGKNEWPYGDYEGCVDVAEIAYDIIYMHSLTMEVAEIAWILQNRFGVEESVIHDAIARSAIEEFADGNLNDLVHNEKLAPLFQFPVAYTIFLFYFDDIVKNTAKYAFAELEEKYGIECTVVKT